MTPQTFRNKVYLLRSCLVSLVLRIAMAMSWCHIVLWWNYPDLSRPIPLFISNSSCRICSETAFAIAGAWGVRVMKNPAYIRSDKGTQIATIIIYTVVACDKKSKFMMVYVLCNCSELVVSMQESARFFRICFGCTERMTAETFTVSPTCNPNDFCIGAWPQLNNVFISEYIHAFKTIEFPPSHLDLGCFYSPSSTHFPRTKAAVAVRYGFSPSVLAHSEKASNAAWRHHRRVLRGQTSCRQTGGILKIKGSCVYCRCSQTFWLNAFASQRNTPREALFLEGLVKLDPLFLFSEKQLILLCTQISSQESLSHCDLKCICFATQSILGFAYDPAAIPVFFEKNILLP